MDKVYFSASNVGFYMSNIHGDRIPSDAVEISRDTYFKLIHGQEDGGEIKAGDDGYPILVDRNTGELIPI